MQTIARVELFYPEMQSDLMQSNFQHLFHEEYLHTMQKLTEQQKINGELKTKIEELLPTQELNYYLQAEIGKLRKLNMMLLSTATESADKQSADKDKKWQSLMSHVSHEYVREIEKQLSIYREKVLYLTQQSQLFVGSLKKSVKTLIIAQEDIVCFMFLNLRYFIYHAFLE